MEIYISSIKGATTHARPDEIDSQPKSTASRDFTGIPVTTGKSPGPSVCNVASDLLAAGASTLRRTRMGCVASSEAQNKGAVKKIRKPKPWKHPIPITKSQLNQMREEFWDTAPHYGGRKEIWDALRAAAEADTTLAQAIVDSAGVIVQTADLTVCYDERGAKYELPNYVLSEPTNLILEG